MAKTKAADTCFTLGAWHLARITVVRWASLPGVGAQAQTTLGLQFKLAVLYRLPDPPNKTPDFVGREAVVYLLCTKDRAPVTTAGRKFLRDMGVELVPTEDGNPKREDGDPKREDGDLKHPRRWLRCQFGPADPIYGYQSIIDWKLADAAQVDAAAGRALRAATKRSPALGLSFPQRGIAERNGHRIDLTASPLAWEVLRCLAHRHPDRYPPQDLVVDAWTAANKRIPGCAEAAARTAIFKLRGTIKPHGLDIPHSHDGLGWCLKEL